MPSDKVIVIGKLGEVAKKIIEIEMLIEKQPNARILLVELASYYKVLDAWPVEDKEVIKSELQIFRYGLELLATYEQELKEASKTGTTIDVCFAVPRYLKGLKEVRERLTKINSLGRFIGDSIELELEENDELLRDAVTS